MTYPEKIFHWIDDIETGRKDGKFFDKFNPATGEILAKVDLANAEDLKRAIEISLKSFNLWKNLPVIKRADILREAARILKEKKEELAAIIALESGKSKKDALSEADAASECGYFMAGEGRRYYGQTLNSDAPDRLVDFVREPIGVGALFVPYNNPIVSIAWKTFPALLCGNVVILKSHEYTPHSAIAFAKILKEAGLPTGVFSVLQGQSDIGKMLSVHPQIKFISFTGSADTAKEILKAGADRLAKISIESGGKNPFVVCDDMDLDLAVSLAVSSAFIDAGQRCTASSRIIIFESVYGAFREKFIAKVKNLKIGVKDDDNFGAIISEKRLNEILLAVTGAVLRGAVLTFGGKRILDEEHKNGYFVEPTVLENISPDDEISQTELFGPVVILYKVKDLNEAIMLANNSRFKLSGAIHTKSINRAQKFIKEYVAGVVRVNGPTYGSEPHMPFGGPGLSGNGWREPGDKALDFYSEWKQISIDFNPNNV